MVKSKGTFEGVDSSLSLAETFPGFGEGNIARWDGIFELNRLFEGHCSLLIGAGLEVNQADVMETRRIAVERLRNLKAFNRFVELLLLGIENTETVISGGVFLVEFENREEGFFGAKRFLVTHRSLGGVPEFLHLHIIAGAAGFFGFLGAENWIQKSEVNRKDENNGDANHIVYYSISQPLCRDLVFYRGYSIMWI